MGCKWGLDAPAHPSATILWPRVTFYKFYAFILWPAASANDRTEPFLSRPQTTSSFPHVTEDGVHKLRRNAAHSISMPRRHCDAFGFGSGDDGKWRHFSFGGQTQKDVQVDDIIFLPGIVIEIIQEDLLCCPAPMSLVWLLPIICYQNTFCRHPPAGLGRMVRGIDAAYLDLLPLESTTDMGYRSVIQWDIMKRLDRTSWTVVNDEAQAFLDASSHPCKRLCLLVCLSNVYLSVCLSVSWSVCLPAIWSVSWSW